MVGPDYKCDSWEGKVRGKVLKYEQLLTMLTTWLGFYNCLSKVLVDGRVLPWQVVFADGGIEVVLTPSARVRVFLGQCLETERTGA